MILDAITADHVVGHVTGVPLGILVLKLLQLLKDWVIKYRAAKEEERKRIMKEEKQALLDELTRVVVNLIDNSDKPSQIPETNNTVEFSAP